MHPLKSIQTVCLLAALGLSQPSSYAQFTITGVSDQSYNTYKDQVGFTVNSQPGYDYLILLDNTEIPVDVTTTVGPDYHELRVWATNQSGGAVSSERRQFVVSASERGSSENGLPPWTYYPTIPSSPAEYAGADLQLLTPQDFPVGYPIPVVAWIRNHEGHPVRVNGALNANGHPSVAIKRGTGSGFLEATHPAGDLVYAAEIGGLQANRSIRLEDSTSWTTASGALDTAAEWPDNSRIHVNGTLTIPAGGTLTIGAGTIVRVNQATDIQNLGHIVINGMTNRPVVFMPATPGQYWGGFIQHANNATFTATGAIFTGSGYRDCWFNGHECSSGLYDIGSHRGQQALISLQGANCNLTLTDCAAIYMRGQFGHSDGAGSQSYLITLTRCLVQRCVTGGEYSDALFNVNDSAFIEFDDDLTRGESPIFVDGDNDGLYITGAPTGQSHAFTNTLFGWTKDDGIDSGGGGAGAFTYQNCWFESIAHEGNSLSGTGKEVKHYQSVFMNCGQGLEAGYDGPQGSLLGCLATGNLVGGRFGDNYDWAYSGFLTAQNSLLIYNYRDVWGMNFDDWTYRTSAMNVQNNFLTASNPNHPNNTVWDPASDGWRLEPYLTIPADAPVGVGLASWQSQGAMSDVAQGLPVRLSSFTTNQVTVNYQAQADSGAVLASGALTFPPGQTLQHISLPIANPENHQVIQVSLTNPSGAEISGQKAFYYLGAGAGQTATTLINRGASWRYRDVASAPPADWNLLSFDASGWPQGPAQLGFGESDQATTIADNNQITSYFRHAFTVEDPAAFASLEMWMLRDDGGIVYLNGNEVYRSSNIPAGTINYSTLTISGQNGENTIDTATLSAAPLQAGDNLVAVEIHQQSATSSDTSFDLELLAQPSPTVNLANFRNTLLAYWFDATYELEQAARLSGPWNSVSEASPMEIQPASGQQFYRLRQR